MRVFFFILLFSLLLPFRGYSQFNISGQDPASVHWQQINTKHFQLVFPEEFADEANRFANLLMFAYEYDAKTLGHQPKKISVLFHSNSVTSNAAATWAHKRLEVYPNPPQDIYAQEWLEQIAEHELRHVVQMDKLNQGFTEVLSVVFGQQAVGGIVSMLPRWFLEGDAVTEETTLSQAGRGRSPSFEMELRALVTSEKGLYSYDKATRGSYRDFVPDHYHYGYSMVAFGRMKYGSELWDKAVDYVGKYPFTIVPFYWGMHKNFGISKSGIYKETFTYLDSAWKKQASEIAYTSLSVLNKNKGRDYTNYRYPQYLSDSVILVHKSGIDQLDEFVTVSSKGKEKKLFTPGPLNNFRLSESGNRLVWTEEMPHVRWDNASYSDIKCLDLNTNHVKRLTRKSRYFSPQFDKTGAKIVAVEVSPSNQFSLVVLDGSTGKLLRKFESPESSYLVMPCWMDNGKDIAVIFLSKKGKGIIKLSTGTGDWDELLAPSFKDLLQLYIWKDVLFFSADYSGIQNVYALNLSTKQVWQVTSSRFGAFDATVSPNGRKIAYADYSSNGFSLAETPFDTSTWVPINKVRNNSVKLYETACKQEKGIIQTDSVPNVNYEVNHYKKLCHLFNFHSWAPFYYDYMNLSLDNVDVYPGVSVISQNLLGTAISSLNYAYKNGYNEYSANFYYLGWFPVIRLSASYGGIPDVYSLRTENLTVQPDNFQFNSTVYLPFNFSLNEYYTGIIPIGTFKYSNPYIINDLEAVGLDNLSRNMVQMKYEIYAYHYLRESDRDLYPRIGQTFYAWYNTSPFNEIMKGSIWAVEGKLYLPGAFRHHSLQIEGGYQEQIPKYFRYSTILAFPRGYNSTASDHLKIIRLDYAFPMFYPDLSIPPILYIKRIKVNLFYDYAENSYKKTDQTKKTTYTVYNYLNSEGLDLTADFYPFRSLFPFEAGLRSIYIPNSGKIQYQLLFSININSF